MKKLWPAAALKWAALKWAAVGALAVLLLVAGLRIAQVNRSYPAPRLAASETETVYGGYGVRLEKAEIFPFDALKIRYDFTGEESDDRFYERKVILLRLGVEKLEEEALAGWSPEMLGLSSLAWKNGAVYGFFSKANEDKPLPEALAVGESESYICAYEINAEQLPPAAWRQVSSRVFDMEFSLYPEKRVLRFSPAAL